MLFRSQVWGFNARRVNRWKNEVSYLAPVPAELTLRGHFQGSLMATLVGLEVPTGSRNLEIKPYAITNVTTDLQAVPRISNDVGGDIGVDVKYGISQNLTSDFTYNTDFAQVEADEQQVNLTRFNLFFPEKREFFLENQGTFAFGGAAASGVNTVISDTPVLFYSRRIGFQRRTGGPHRGRRPPDRQGGSIQPRFVEYRGRQRVAVAVSGHEFLGRPPQARHSPAQQRGRPRHRSFARSRWLGNERGVR